MLSPPKLQAVRALVESVPDATIVGLTHALANSPPGGVLGPVREMVEVEAEERSVRNIALAPIAGLCRGGRRIGRLIYPPRVLRRLWSGLKAQSPGLVAQARGFGYEFEDDESLAQQAVVFNALCAAAGDGLRARDLPDFAAAAEICDSALKSGAETMAACLDLAPVVRSSLPHLHDWMRRMDEDAATLTRLAFRDAVNLAPDAGPRFVEMLGSRLEAPWQTMRLLSTVMDHPSENYLGSSEMAGFALDVLADIDAQLALVKGLDLKRSDPADARAAARAVCDASLAISDFKHCVQVSREGPMGARVIEQKARLAALVEAKLSAIDGLVAAALPQETIRFAGRMTKQAPRLTADPDMSVVRPAEVALIFAEGVRPAAETAGFGSTRAKALEQVNTRLANYTDDLLGHLRGEEAGNLDRARLYLDVAANLLARSQDEKAAQIVRRRAAA